MIMTVDVFELLPGDVIQGIGDVIPNPAVRAVRSVAVTYGGERGTGALVHFTGGRRDTFAAPQSITIDRPAIAGSTGPQPGTTQHDQTR